MMSPTTIPLTAIRTTMGVDDPAGCLRQHKLRHRTQIAMLLTPMIKPVAAPVSQLR